MSTEKTQVPAPQSDSEESVPGVTDQVPDQLMPIPRNALDIQLNEYRARLHEEKSLLMEQWDHLKEQTASYKKDLADFKTMKATQAGRRAAVSALIESADRSLGSLSALEKRDRTDDPKDPERNSMFRTEPDTKRFKNTSDLKFNHDLRPDPLGWHDTLPVPAGTGSKVSIIVLDENGKHWEIELFDITGKVVRVSVQNGYVLGL